MKLERTKRRSAKLAIVLVSLFGVSASAFEPPDVEIAETRAALEKWVETRRIISQEKRDWVIGKEMLADRIDLVRREVESVRARIEESETNITEADRKRVELLDENERLKDASVALTEALTAMESQTVALLKRLPPPVLERVKPLTQRLPNDTAETKLSTSERFLTIVGIVNEINKFNRELTMTSEVRSLSDGTAAAVTVLYVGLGHAYYVGANNSVAGFGRATEEGWTWTPANNEAAVIARAIAILKNEQVAAFVKLPIHLDAAKGVSP